MLRYNPQPTQPCDIAPVAIAVVGDSSRYGNVDSDNNVGDSNNDVDAVAMPVAQRGRSRLVILIWQFFFLDLP